MASWISRLKEHFHGEETPFDEPTRFDGAFSRKRVLLILGIWLVLWGVWQSLCIGNAAIDVAENIAWGQNFDWGYDKNPYFGAWFSYAVFRIFHDCFGEYVFYFVSLFSALLGLFAVYLLAGELFKSRFAAFLVVPLALLVPYFSHSACEFNDDMLSIPLYALTGLFFHRSVRSNSTGDWLAAGLCAGLALMTKYLAGALLLPLGLLLIFTPEGRACWKKPGIYLGAALFLLLILPNMVWLYQHDFIALEYAAERAELGTAPGWGSHVIYFLDAWGAYLLRLILPLAALCLLPRGRAPAPGSSKFDRLFIFAVGLGPMILSSLFALLTGGRVLRSWLTPYYVFLPLLPIMWYRPIPELRPLKRLVVLVVIASLFFMAVTAYEFLYRRPYKGKHCNYQNFPGKKLASILTGEWRKRFATPCPYVIGDRTNSCYMCYYSPDHPRAFFKHDPKLSPWIDPADLRKRGAVIIWQEEPPKYLDRYPDALSLPPITLERQIPAWVRTFAPAPKEEIFYVLLVPPSSSEHSPEAASGSRETAFSP